jgi:tellurite resistance protein TehA-like permease
VRYESGLWSMVFPLGMYAVASILYGRTEHLGFMVWIGRTEIWVALTAWVAVPLGMLHAARR